MVQPSVTSMAGSDSLKSTFVTEIPEELKTLVSCVARGFYPYEYAIVMDYLMYYPCLKEDDIVDLLKFDRKQLRSIMALLKNDKLVKTKMRLETSADGKSQRHNYYFINYQVMVNVVKYKLDHMRRKIETEERDSTSRASFICPTCNKTFTDLEVDQLYDPMSGCLRCSYCGSEVEEDAASNPQKDSRTILVKFNEQFQLLFDLLRKVENVKLAPELLDPDPTVLSAIKGKRNGNRASRDPDAGWSGDATRGTGIDYEKRISINIGNGDVDKEEQQKKEGLRWMQESTIDGSMAESVWKEGKDDDADTKPETTVTKNQSQEIATLLLVHEKKGGAPPPAISGLNRISARVSDEDSSSSDSEDDFGAKPKIPKATFEATGAKDDRSESEEEEGEDVPLVMVGGRQIPLSEVDEEVTSRMTQQERDAWIQLAQKSWADHFE